MFFFLLSDGLRPCISLDALGFAGASFPANVRGDITAVLVIQVMLNVCEFRKLHKHLFWLLWDSVVCASFPATVYAGMCGCCVSGYTMGSVLYEPATNFLQWNV